MAQKRIRRRRRRLTNKKQGATRLEAPSLNSQNGKKSRNGKSTKKRPLRGKNSIINNNSNKPNNTEKLHKYNIYKNQQLLQKYNKMKWTTKTTYVDNETGEQIYKRQVTNGQYIKLGVQTKHIKHNKDYGTKINIWKCEINRQTKLEI